jgi:hypothetical protein
MCDSMTLTSCLSKRSALVQCVAASLHTFVLILHLPRAGVREWRTLAMWCGILAHWRLFITLTSCWSKRSAFLQCVPASLHTFVLILHLSCAEAREAHSCNVLWHLCTLSSFYYSYLLLEQDKCIPAMCCSILAQCTLSSFSNSYLLL